jgi:hypothetical protein
VGPSRSRRRSVGCRRRGQWLRTGVPRRTGFRPAAHPAAVPASTEPASDTSASAACRMPRTWSSTAAAPPPGSEVPRQAMCWSGRTRTAPSPYTARSDGSERCATVNGSPRLAEEDLLQHRLRGPDSLGSDSRPFGAGGSGERRPGVRGEVMTDQRGDEARALIPFRREGPLVADGLQQPPPPEVLNGASRVAHRPGADQRRLARPVDNGDLDAVGGELHRSAKATRPGTDDENLDLGRRGGDREATV